MRLVVVESPYAGQSHIALISFFQRLRNKRYARACLRDSLDRGEAPWASHLLYTQPGVLRDENPHQRARGIDAGLAWGKRADATVVYTDLGISKGMLQGIRAAEDLGRPVEYRVLRVPIKLLAI